MLVRRIGKVYQFESPTVNGAFIVRLTLTDSGKEELETCPVGAPVCFKPQVLPKGTIKKLVGPQRWKNFLRMKDKGINTMFIDPFKGAPMPYTW